jgi:hypothetical protein
LKRVVAAMALLLGLAPVTAAEATGVAMEGTDRARIQLPAVALAESYGNFGYALSVAGGIAEVTVDLRPLESREPFTPPRVEGRESAVRRLARSVTAGATNRYDASSRLLDWVARHIRYELDRQQPQEAAAVLERRSGYCTGISRLTVALLEAVGIPAREVPGFVAESAPGRPAGYQRWVEIFYGDRGWVYSDPLLAQHYVPATYVRLASEVLMADAGDEHGRLLQRHDHRAVVDLFRLAPPGVSARRNHAAQIAGALDIEVGGGASGMAVLEGAGHRRVGAVIEGRSTFVGLEPGTYLLTVHLDGHPPVTRRIVFRGRVRGSVTLSMPSQATTGGLPAAAAGAMSAAKALPVSEGEPRARFRSAGGQGEAPL